MFIKDKSFAIFPVIVISFVLSKQSPSGWLGCESDSPKSVKKILTEW